MARSPDRRDHKRSERDRRDDRGGYKRRSRSREVRREHESDGRSLTRNQHRHRERSYDRYSRDDRDRRRPDRSRDGDRKRHRDRSPSPVRDKYDRHRDSRDRYDDRDRKRPRHDDYSSRHDEYSSRHDDYSSRHDDYSSRPGTSTSSGTREYRDRSPPRRSNRDRIDDEEAKKAERLAKVQRMKQQIGIKTANDTSSAGGNTPISTTAATSSLDNGETTNASFSPTPIQTRLPQKKPVSSSDISRRAAAAMAKTLGGDIVVPKPSSQKPYAMTETPLYSADATEDSGITGFGLGKTSSSKNDKVSTRLASGLGDDDEDAGQKKMSRLPANDLFSNSKKESTLLYEDQDDDDEEMKDDAQPDKQEDKSADGKMQDEDEEVDPLDAYMNNLEAPPDAELDVLSDLRKGGRRGAHLFDADDGYSMSAVGDKNDDFTLALKKKRKDMPTVKHESIQYQDFRKSFYTEPLQLAQITEEELEVLRADLDNITVHGADVPKPISTFTQGGFGSQILDVIRDDLKYEKPSAIQAQALPAIMSGRDTIGIAKTGSGKTMAYLLPMFRHVKDQPPVANMDGPIALILAPTRELVVQIHRDCKPFLKALRLRAVSAYGGVPISEQIAELKRGAEIVVATPGRMIDLLAANAGRVTNLRRITYLVMDEADRMFDMGFEPQVSRIMNNIRPDRQSVLFSATFPKTMDALARKALTQPVEILVGGRSVVAPEIEQIIEVREQKTKFLRTLELLGENHINDDSRSLIFVERQESADILFKELTSCGYPTGSVHGGRDQIDRDQNISDFKAGHIPVLVATSVAARGLDVKQLTLVVNYDCPNHNEDYVHRCGRTGRAGNTGTAVTFITPEQARYAPFLVHALKESKKEVPEPLLKLAEEFKTKIKSGEAKAAHDNAGFGGHGIERLEAARNKQRKAEGKLHLKNEAGDQGQDEDDKEDRDKKQADVDKLMANVTSTVKARDEPSSATNDGGMDASIAQVLKDAMKVHKTAMPEATKKTASGANDKQNSAQRLAAMAASINSRLGGKGPNAAVEANRGPDAGAFHAILQINDLPQRARWAVTNRSNVAKVLEATGTSITTKGNYYAPGKEPQAGELPKLYVLVEGDTQDQVETAMSQLTGMLREGLIQDANSKNMAQSSGRYSVV